MEEWTITITGDVSEPTIQGSFVEKSIGTEQNSKRATFLVKISSLEKFIFGGQVSLVFECIAILFQF